MCTISKTAQLTSGLISEGQPSFPVVSRDWVQGGQVLYVTRWSSPFGHLALVVLAPLQEDGVQLAVEGGWLFEEPVAEVPLEPVLRVLVKHGLQVLVI